MRNARQDKAILGIVVLDVFDEAVAHGLDAADEPLAGHVDLVIGVCQRQIQARVRTQLETTRDDDIDTGVLDVDRVGVERDRPRRGARRIRRQRRHWNITGTIDSIINLDLVDIRRNCPVVTDVRREAGTDIQRLLFRQRRRTCRLGIRVADREQAFFDLQSGRAVKRRDNRRYVGLARRRRVESRGYRAAQRKAVVDAEARRQLAVERAAEVREILVARSVLHEQLVGYIVFDVSVDCDVIALEVAGIDRLHTAEAARTATEVGVRLAGKRGKRFFTRFETEREVDPVAHCEREVCIQVFFLLRIAADIEIALRNFASRAGTDEGKVAVDRVVEEVVELVLAEAVAEVIQHAAIELTFDTNDETRIILVAVQERREPGWQARITVRAMLRQAGVVRGAVEKPVTAFRFSEAETCIQLRGGADVESGIQEEAHAGCLRAAPALQERRITERRISTDLRQGNTGRKQRILIRLPLDTTRQRIVVDVFETRVDKAGLADTDTNVRSCLDAALAVEVLAGLHLYGATFGRILEHEVDHTRDRVGTVLRRGAVTQDFDTLQGDAGNHADIDAMGTVAGRRCEKLYQCRTVPALAINKDQGLVRRRPAQRGRAHKGAAVAGRRCCRVRRDECFQVIRQVCRVAERVELIGVQYVDGHWRIGR